MYASLSDEALLATLTGPEQARRLLARHRSLNLVVREATRPYLADDSSLRNALPDPIVVAVELVRRSHLAEISEASCLSSPDEVAQYLKLTIGQLEHEVFYVLFLDSGNRVIAAEEMFRGTLAQTSVYPREIVKRTLFHNAGSVIFAHNHPSGDMTPSNADQRLTSMLKDALALVDVRVLDHVIVGGANSMSFASRGIL